MKRDEISQALFKALLDHYWWAKDENVPKGIETYPQGYCISYGDLVKRAKVPIIPRYAGRYLF